MNEMQRRVYKQTMKDAAKAGLTIHLDTPDEQIHIKLDAEDDVIYRSETLAQAMSFVDGWVASNTYTKSRKKK